MAHQVPSAESFSTLTHRTTQPALHRQALRDGRVKACYFFANLMSF